MNDCAIARLTGVPERYRLGVHWTRSTKYIVSIYRKADTARLDEFIGPKSRAVPLEGVHYAA